MRKIELLAPAGNIQAVRQAIHHGADAVYMGGKSFGARAYANNFTREEMKQAIDFAHLYGGKVFITVNTLVFQHEVEAFLAHVETIYQMGADALIMQDAGMIVQVKEHFPDIEIHASTQMHNHNNASLCFTKRLGMTRAVLAREMSLKQIKDLNCDIEKEVFVHGALCISYSGQCLMSAMTEQRSGNRGRCAQSCRMRYTVTDSKGKPVRTDGEFVLSPKDLALYEDIDALLDAGIGCFKIEGRMKSPEYVGQATKIYSELLSNYADGRTLSVAPEQRSAMKRLFNRGFTKGHLFEQTGAALMGRHRPNHQGVPLGQVVEVRKDRIILRLDAPLAQGDGIKFEQSDSGFICNKVYLKGKLVSKAQTGQTISLDNKAPARACERIVKTSDVLLNARLSTYEEKKIAITGYAVAKKGEPLVLMIQDAAGHAVTVQGNMVQQSRTRPITEEELRAGLGKLGGTPFVLDALDVQADGDIFVAKSQVNALRRKAADALAAERTRIMPRRIRRHAHVPLKTDALPDQSLLHVLVRNAWQFEAVKDIVTGDIYTNDEKLYRQSKAALPNLRLRTDKLAKQTVTYCGERLLVTDNGGLEAYHRDNDIVLDYSLNALNAYTLSLFTSMSARRVALSPELSIKDIDEMMQAYRRLNGQLPVLEAPVYIRYEMMAMQHCVISDNKNCNRCRNERYFLCDVKGNRYPIVTDLQCNNYVLSQLYRQADIASLHAAGVRHYRIELLDEDAAESRNVIKTYLKQIGEMA